MKFSSLNYANDYMYMYMYIAVYGDHYYMDEYVQVAGLGKVCPEQNYGSI